METLLNGVHVVVTGASSGIGRAIALATARAGATVIAVGRRTAALQTLVEEAADDRIVPHTADLQRQSDVEELARRTLDSTPELGALVHCAGITLVGPIQTADIEDLDRQYRINVRAPYLLSRLLAPALVRAKGQILFVNSSAGTAARANLVAYSASKHALRAVADGFRIEFNELGVRVATIYPGRTASPRQEELHALEGKDYRPEDLMQPSDIASLVVQLMSLPKTAEVTDVHMRPSKKTG